MAGESELTFQKCFQLGFCLSRFKIIVRKIKSSTRRKLISPIVVLVKLSDTI